MKIFMLSKRVSNVPYEHPVLHAGRVYDDYPDDAATALISQRAAREVLAPPVAESPETTSFEGAPETAVQEPVKKVRRKRG